MERGTETNNEEEDNDNEEGDRERDIPSGAQPEVGHMGGGRAPPPKENVDLPDFTPESEHLLLQGLYGDYHITTMGCIWTGEYQTTLSGSGTGAG